eukprot:592281-Prymnesium_polylepis.1
MQTQVKPMPGLTLRGAGTRRVRSIPEISSLAQSSLSVIVCRLLTVCEFSRHEQLTDGAVVTLTVYGA